MTMMTKMHDYTLWPDGAQYVHKVGSRYKLTVRRA